MDHGTRAARRGLRLGPAPLRLLAGFGERYCEIMRTIATLCEVGDRLRSIAKEVLFGIAQLEWPSLKRTL